MPPLSSRIEIIRQNAAAARSLHRCISVRTVAAGRAIRDIGHLRKKYGAARWRKRKGYAKVRLTDGTIGHGEVHWYEAHGIGKKELKLKWFVED